MLPQLATLTSFHLFDPQTSMGVGRSSQGHFSVNEDSYTLLKQSLSLPRRTAFLTNVDGFLKLANSRIEVTTRQIENLQRTLQNLSQWKDDAIGLAETLVAIQEKDIEPVPDLPTDILWTIFSAAASDSISTAYKLSFVSKEVQKWVDPFLFQRISIGHNPAHLTNAIGASCRLSYATQFTKEVHVTRTLTSPADMNPFVEAFSQFPVFKALSARVTPQGRYGSWNISIPGVEVRHLYWELDSAKLGALRHLSSNFTHLAIDVTSQVAFQYDWSALNGLKTICILAVDVMGGNSPSTTLPRRHGSDNIRAGIARIQSATGRLTSPSLHTVLWREGFSADDIQEFHNCVEDVTDLRLIICVAKLPSTAPLVNGGLWPFLELNSYGKLWSLGLRDQVQGLRGTK